MLDLSVEQLRSLVRAGFLEARRGTRGEYRFSFQDLVLLRTAKGLQAANVSPPNTTTWSESRRSISPERFPQALRSEFRPDRERGR